MQSGRNYFDILSEMIDVLTNDKKADIRLLLQNIGTALGLDNVFMAERANNGGFIISNAWNESNCCFDEGNLIIKKHDETCLSIEEEQASKLIYSLKARGITPVIVVFVKNQKSYSWNEYEKGMLRSFCRLLRSYLVNFSTTNTDKLTGMPSLTDFMYEMEKRQGELVNKYAVVASDILGFKNINNVYGYEFGNKVLKYIADLIKKSSHTDEFYCRVTADKFISVIRCENIKSIAQVINKTTKIIEKHFPEFATTSCKWKSGVYVLNGSEIDAMQAIDNANYALYAAKHSDTEHIIFYNRDIEEKINKSRYIVSNMKNAIENEEFVVYFQPLLELSTGKMVGSEALVRWIKDERVIPPSEFIPLFEENNFMSELDFYVYEKVCQYISSWIKQSYPVYPVSVNISRLHLKERDFVERFITLIDKYNVPHYLLELEITENIFINNMDDAIKFIQDLKAHGFICAIDDFGSGFSSLNILRHLPVDVLKLDKEFLHEDVNYHINQQIIYHTIKLAKSLNMKVLAEGVENVKQSQYLLKCGCDMAQGYLFAKPMSAEDFTALIKTY